MLTGTTRDSHLAPRDERYRALLDALLEQLSELAEHIRAAIQAQLASYRAMNPEILGDQVRLQVEWVLRFALGGCAATNDSDLAELAEIGEARAQQGVPLDDLLCAWRIGVEAVVADTRRISGQMGIADATVLEFVQSVLARSDAAMVATAGAHHRAELASRFAEEEQRAAFVRAALLGTASVTELVIQAEAYGLDPGRDYVAVRALLSEGAPRRRLEWALGFHGASAQPSGLSAVLDGCMIGFLNDPPPRDVDAAVGIGPPKPLEHLAESYRLAGRALAAVQAFGLRGVHGVPTLGLRAAVVGDGDVGDALRKRYLEPLADGGSARELIATLHAYLTCGMRVERTASRLFVHQNTVRYRLARFEELTGANLRDVEVLFGVWWALEAQRCVCRSPQGDARTIGDDSLPGCPRRADG